MDMAMQVEVVKRLRSVEGHLRGVLHMVEEGRPCLEMVRQTQAIQGSVRQISLLLLTQHMDVCLREAYSQPDIDGYQQLRDELLTLFSQKV